MTAFRIGKRDVGDGSPVMIIAELSANHGGKIETALKTIDAAAEAGADAIKLQTYTPDTLTLKSNAPPFVVKTKNVWEGRTLHDLYAEAMTPWEWHAELKARAESRGLLCFSTPFDPTAVEFLETLDVPAHKVASFEIVDLPLVQRVARTGKPVIISTGMATLGEIQAAIEACRDEGNDQIAVLRCVSCYPASPEDMHLESLRVLKELGVVIGLSDHTRDNTVAIASVVLGAKLIEKHFILGRSIGGPDAFFSLEPHELKALVRDVREAESAMRPPRFGPSEHEKNSLAFRRSLFIAKNVKAGEIITCDAVRSVRPADGLSVEHLPTVLGRGAARDLFAGTALAWADVGAPAARTPIVFRRATMDDAAVLLAWRNDAQTREMSVRSEIVEEADHVKWLTASLASPDRHLFIAAHEGMDVGQVRLDRQRGSTWEVSITVAPAARGRSLSTPMLFLAEDTARALGIKTLVAKIRSNNERSMRAFKRAGYYSFVEVGPFWLCERRAAPYT